MALMRAAQERYAYNTTREVEHLPTVLDFYGGKIARATLSLNTRHRKFLQPNPRGLPLLLKDISSLHEEASLFAHRICGCSRSGTESILIYGSSEEGRSGLG